MKDFVERKTVRWPKRKHDRIFSGRRLQFEIELAAKTFAQRQSPGAIQPAAKRRMQHQLHAAAVVKESFEHEIVLRRHHAQHNLRAGKIFNNLFGRRARDADFVGQIVDRRFEIDRASAWLSTLSVRACQLAGSGRCFAVRVD